MPMRLDEGWNQIQFNLSDFTRRAYGESFPERHTFPCPISLEILNLTPPQAQITSKHSASRFTRTVEYGGFTSLTVCTRKMSFRRSSSFSFPSRFVVVVNFFSMISEHQVSFTEIRSSCKSLSCQAPCFLKQRGAKPNTILSCVLRFYLHVCFRSLYIRLTLP